MAAATSTQTEAVEQRDSADTAGRGAATAEEGQLEASLCTGEGERLGLFAIIGESGPVTVFGLAQGAEIPVSLTLRWLASQTRSGHVVRDVVTGRYRTWCVLPEPD